MRACARQERSGPDRCSPIACREPRRPSSRWSWNANVARAYGRIYASVAGAERTARGARSLDLLIAPTALAFNLPLYTRNPDDFHGTEGLIEVVAVAPAT